MIIAKLQSWALTALAVLAVLVGAYAMGGRAARRSVEIDRVRRDEKSREAAKNVARKVDQMDDDSLADEFDRLRDKRRR
ncbi:hypothetical protein ACMHYO_14415 [Allopusillimonas ginsengisoli]|uniref:hypothetical protein n=1 Tax=Allopusillimonas ginsengisoli TaxID=453575 RepID=UPI0039C4DE3E